MGGLWFRKGELPWCRPFLPPHPPAPQRRHTVLTLPSAAYAWKRLAGEARLVASQTREAVWIGSPRVMHPASPVCTS